ncbi:hypothetical protein OB920_13315 [Halobacteria archaeon HArc-gm2]|nr:hypothetical protein [Halobacteria archaeon HArc-gm2]
MANTNLPDIDDVKQRSDSITISWDNGAEAHLYGDNSTNLRTFWPDGSEANDTITSLDSQEEVAIAILDAYYRSSDVGEEFLGKEWGTIFAAILDEKAV